MYAEARECRAIEDFTVWKHSGGIFHRYTDATGRKKWVEFDSERRQKAEYDEVQQQSGASVLRDPVKEIELLLRRDMCAMKRYNEREYQQLYAGGWVKVARCVDS